jgi:hypothetical protein
LNCCEGQMADFIYLAVGLGLFGLMALYVRACARL